MNDDLPTNPGWDPPREPTIQEQTDAHFAALVGHVVADVVDSKIEPLKHIVQAGIDNQNANAARFSRRIAGVELTRYPALVAAVAAIALALAALALPGRTAQAQPSCTATGGAAQ